MGEALQRTPAERQKVNEQQAEMKRLKAELKRVNLKKAVAYFAKMSGEGTPSFAIVAMSIRSGGFTK